MTEGRPRKGKEPKIDHLLHEDLGYYEDSVPGDPTLWSTFAELTRTRNYGERHLDRGAE